MQHYNGQTFLSLQRYRFDRALSNSLRFEGRKLTPLGDSPATRIEPPPLLIGLYDFGSRVVVQLGSYHPVNSLWRDFRGTSLHPALISRKSSETQEHRLHL